MLGSRKQLIPVLAAVLAYRRVPIENALLRVLPSCPPEQVGHALWALGRVGGDGARAALGAYLRSEDAQVAATACRALIRLGDEQALRHGLLVAQLKPWPLLALGIGGARTAVNVLTDIVAGPAVSADALLALGLLGDLASVKAIHQCLSNAECAAAAATALQTITGAPLYEDVFVAEVVEPDELFDEERELYERTGKLPASPDDESGGSRVTQISLNPETWRAWLAAHRSRFDPKGKYRHGKPHSPAAMVECLAAESTPNRVRELIADELVVRYRAPVVLEIDMTVREQDKHLTALAAWAGAHEREFAPGAWHFAGRRSD
jgi:hypothetical protein